MRGIGIVARVLGVMALLGGLAHGAQTEERPRLLVLTDFFKDPDDQQSLIRLLTYANEFEIEGFVATSLAFGDGSVHPEWIEKVIDAYGEVLPKLRLHARPGYTYPEASALKSRVRGGAPVIRNYVDGTKGFPVPYPPGARDSRTSDPASEWVGPGKDTPGSDFIIEVVDRDDPRPVWVTVWGGAMDLAQALWKVRSTRTPEETARFVEKLRVYQNSWQDTGTVWIWNEFPELFLILNFEAHRGMYGEGPAAMRQDDWVNENVRQGHGPLGALYLKAGDSGGIKEGDSPTFLYLLARGLSDPVHPEWGCWGGRFERLDAERQFYVDARDRNPDSEEAAREKAWTIGRWKQAASNDFQARMDWCVRGYGEANHAPVAVVDGDMTEAVLRRVVHCGEELTLDASASTDPDGDGLTYLWWQYEEAGTCRETPRIEGANEATARVTGPEVDAAVEAHLIVNVTDEGEPALTRYRRVIVTVMP